MRVYTVIDADAEELERLKGLLWHSIVILAVVLVIVIGELRDLLAV